MKRRISTRQMVESGILLAIGFVLSMIKVKLIPGGGSVTAVSMLPIIVLAYKYGPVWGCFCGFVHGFLQLVEGGGIAPPTRDFASFALVFLLDYALAWAVVGLLAGLLRGISTSPRAAIAGGAVFGIAGRFVCSFLSGVIIWGVYAPEGQSAAVYSLAANLSYLLPEIIITAVASFALFSVPAMYRQVAPAR